MGGRLRALWRRLRGAATGVDDPARPPIDRIKSRWAAEGIEPRPGASPEALAAFEAHHRVALPSAFREFYGAVDGTGEASDDAHIRFWTFVEVIPIAEEYARDRAELPEFEDWFLFADFLICSHWFAVRLTPDPTDGGTVAAFDGTGLEVQALAFDMFLTRYLADRENLSLAIPPDRRWLAGDDGADPG